MRKLSLYAFFGVLSSVLFSQQLLAESTAVYGGFNTQSKSDYYYVGAVHAVNGDVSSSGVTIKAQVGRGEYDYDTVGVPGGKVDGDQDRVSLSAGYQWVTSNLHVAAYLGADVQDHDLSPRDPLNDVNGNADGVISSVEVETRGSGAYAAFIGDYSTAYETYWARARAGVVDTNTKFGVELTVGGNASHDTERYGLFMLYPLTDKVRLDVTVGRFDTEGENSRKDDDGNYVGVGFATTF